MEVLILYADCVAAIFPPFWCITCSCRNISLFETENNEGKVCLLMLIVYFQLLGRFHVLSDFDEGKRSCRRKLERHNNRRRRKPVDSTATIDSDRAGMHLEDVSCDGEVGKGNNLKQLQQHQSYDYCIIGFLTGLFSYR